MAASPTSWRIKTYSVMCSGTSSSCTMKGKRILRLTCFKLSSRRRISSSSRWTPCCKRTIQKGKKEANTTREAALMPMLTARWKHWRWTPGARLNSWTRAISLGRHPWLAESKLRSVQGLKEFRLSMTARASLEFRLLLKAIVVQRLVKKRGVRARSSKLRYLQLS